MKRLVGELQPETMLALCYIEAQKWRQSLDEVPPRARAVAALVLVAQCSVDDAERALKTAIGHRNPQWSDPELNAVAYWVQQAASLVRHSTPRRYFELVKGGDTNVIRLARGVHGGVRAIVMYKATLRDEVRNARTRAENALVQGQPLANDNDPERAQTPTWNFDFTRVQRAAVLRRTKEMRDG